MVHKQQAERQNWFMHTLQYMHTSPSLDNLSIRELSAWRSHGNLSIREPSGWGTANLVLHLQP